MALCVDRKERTVCVDGTGPDWTVPSTHSYDRGRLHSPPATRCRLHTGPVPTRLTRPCRLHTPQRRHTRQVECVDGTGPDWTGEGATRHEWRVWRPHLMHQLTIEVERNEVEEGVAAGDARRRRRHCRCD